jgi:dipeptidyl-peptidase 4
MKKTALLTFGFICIFSLFLSAQTKQITLNEIWGSRLFVPKNIDEIRSMNDGQTYSILKNNSIIVHSYKSGKEVRTILKGKELTLDGNPFSLEIEDYEFSADEKLLLLTTGIDMIYRHSYVADYYIFNVQSNNLKKLSSGGKQQLAEIAPDGKHAAFVRDNNIFLVELSTMQETQITTDGEFNKIINGAPDWVYEEEFSFSKGFFWSPDSRKIAFYKFDESEVKEFTLMNYNGDEYPELYTFKYPKAGEDNSVVDVYVYHLDNRNVVKVDAGSETDQYIPRVDWTQNPEMLWFQRLNRIQNELEILIADATNGKTKVIYTETNKYYIDITDNLTFLNNGKHFIMTSEKDGFNHIYMYDLNGNQVQQITKGTWDVTELLKIDEPGKKIFFKSSEKGPVHSMLYSIDFDGNNKRMLFEKPGTYHADFSSNSAFFILRYSGADSPPQFAVYDAKLKMQTELENNAELKQTTSDYGFVKREFSTLTTSENIELHYWIMKPEQLEPGRQYPLLIYVYGGPGSQTVQNQWGRFDYIWFQMLVQNGFIVASVDNRGTGARGEEFKKCTYLQLGKLETADQIEAAKYFGDLPFIDKTNIGIFGWSYGGYLSSLCMTKGADVFKAGIAVAPVTNWRYYDNIYTERFMRTPAENPDGYDKNSPVFYAKKMKGPFLIVHGDADDNVHVQNTHELVNALISANKQFEMFVYPNRNHGIYGGYTRLHLYQKMTDFLYNHLKK